MTESHLQSRLPVADSFSAEYLEYYCMLPLEIIDGRLRVAITGEPSPEATDDLQDSYGATVDLVPVPADELQAAIRRAFASSESVLELVRDLSEEMGTAVERETSRSPMCGAKPTRRRSFAS